MNKIITIGRQFGSGGREFGKRLADELGCPYYDQEIMTEIAKRTALAEEYVQRIVENSPDLHFPITVGRSFHGGSDYLMHQQMSVYAEQANAIRDLASKSDCVIVGCCADYILRDKNITRIFVYADMDSCVARCREKGGADEALTDAQLRRKIRSINRGRRKYYRYYTGQAWGDRSNYDICLNTSNTSIKSAAHALAMMIKAEE